MWDNALRKPVQRNREMVGRFEEETGRLLAAQGFDYDPEALKRLQEEFAALKNRIVTLLFEDHRRSSSS